jgi:hypothetical protein
MHCRVHRNSIFARHFHSAGDRRDPGFRSSPYRRCISPIVLGSLVVTQFSSCVAAKRPWRRQSNSCSFTKTIFRGGREHASCARLLRAARETRPPLLADRGETAIVCVLNLVPRRFAGARVKDSTLRVEGRSDIAEYKHGTVTVAVRSITRSSSARSSPAAIVSFPAPAASNVACGFPGLRSPVCCMPWVMRLWPLIMHNAGIAPTCNALGVPVTQSWWGPRCLGHCSRQLLAQRPLITSVIKRAKMLCDNGRPSWW